MPSIVSWDGIQLVVKQATGEVILAQVMSDPELASTLVRVIGDVYDSGVTAGRQTVMRSVRKHLEAIEDL